MSVKDFIKIAHKKVELNKQVKESDIEGKFVTYAKSRGCWAIQLIILNKRGFPDRTVLLPGGRVIFIEFKKKGKTQTELQKSIERKLVGLGFKYYVCDEMGQAENILRGLLRGD